MKGIITNEENTSEKNTNLNELRYSRDVLEEQELSVNVIAYHVTSVFFTPTDLT